MTVTAEAAKYLCALCENELGSFTFGEPHAETLVGVGCIQTALSKPVTTSRAPTPGELRHSSHVQPEPGCLPCSLRRAFPGLA